MFLKRCHREKNGRSHAYWALVESYRTERGPRHRVVAYLGASPEVETPMPPADPAARHHQPALFGNQPEQYAEIDTANVEVERLREFGTAWIGLEMMRRLQLLEWAEQALPSGREDIPWPVMAAVLVLCRFCRPSSELRIAEQFYAQTALADLLGVPAAKVNDDRLYRALDHLLPAKAALEVHLKERLGELFRLQYDLLLYDVTSTYFEGEAEADELAQRGYSRDSRPDCRQVCIGLVVTREGIPLGYELFAGNTADVTTVEHMVRTMESRYGRADRVWAMDRGMASESNLNFLRQGRRYIIGTPKSMLRQFERQLLEGGWRRIRPDLEVKLCPGPDHQERFVLCRSGARREKEEAMLERFAKRIATGLQRIEQSCLRRALTPAVVAHRVGALMARNSRAAKLFHVTYETDSRGACRLGWRRDEQYRQWAALANGAYLLRTNVTDWNEQELWEAYIHLTDAEEAFRIQKTELRLRPVWHQKTERVEAHILVCFLAFVLWKTLAQMAKAAGLGDSCRKILDEMAMIRTVDVVMKTRQGKTVRRRCVTRPSEHQAILLQYLKIRLPSQLRITKCSQDFEKSFVAAQEVTTLAPR